MGKTAFVPKYSEIKQMSVECVNTSTRFDCYDSTIGRVSVELRVIYERKRSFLSSTPVAID